MSTKTTFKRIALVAVAALGFGMLSVVPSSATVNDITGNTGFTLTGTTTAATYSTIAGTNNYVGFLLDTTGTAPKSVTVSGGTAISTGAAGSGTSSLVVNPTGSSTAFTVPTPTVGTITVSVFGFTAGVQNASASSTLTITVTAAPVAPNVASTKSTSIIQVGSSAPGGSDVAVLVDKAAGQAGNITVSLLDVNSVATTSTSLTAVITGPGILGGTSAEATRSSAATGRAITIADGDTNGVFDVTVWSDGTAGTATITLSAGTTVVGVKTVIFSGPATAYTVAQSSSVYDINSAAPGSPGVQTVTVTVKDAAGNLVVNGTTVYASSGTTAVAAVTASTTTTSGVATFTVVGATEGTSVLSFGNAATSATVTGTTTIAVGSATIATVTLKTDKASYLPGQMFTLTVSATSAAGNPVADGTYTVFSAAPSSSMALAAGLLPVASQALVNGVKSFTLNAPVTESAFTIAGADNTSAAKAVSVTATVAPSAATQAAADIAQAAVDAASEATDAANAATDAANAAAEAADAATAAAQDAADAVAALSVQVASLIADLKAQISAQAAAITALTNLIIKIQKKVKA